MDMSIRDALEIVLDLARENALEERDADGDGTLLDMMEKQSEAIEKMDEVLETIDDKVEELDSRGPVIIRQEMILDIPEDMNVRVVGEDDDETM